MVRMQRAVKEALGTETFEPTGTLGGGCISSGATYYTDNGEVFVKWNSGSNVCYKVESIWIDGLKNGIKSDRILLF